MNSMLEEDVSSSLQRLKNQMVKGRMEKNMVKTLMNEMLRKGEISKEQYDQILGRPSKK